MSNVEALKFDLMVERSLINSHCVGMDSIVFTAAPRMLRVFIARREHELWRNGSQGMRGLQAMSVAFHPHHCDVTLIPIFGKVYNITPGIGDVGLGSLQAFHYQSPIGAHEGKFVPVQRVAPRFARASTLRFPTYMPASQLHTVYVPKGEAAAWWVFEGAEDEQYDGVVYSNAALETFDFSTINLPMTHERLREDLAMIGVHY